MADSSVTHEFDELIESLGKLDTEVVKSSIDVAIDKLVKMLQESAKFSEYSDGTLQQSISALPSKKTADGYIVELEWEEYGTYQDAGVAGVKSGQSLGSELGYGKNFSYTDKMPPASAFEKFARVNNVSAFAAARSVFMNGLKPTKWASNVLDSNKIDEVLDEVAELIVKLYELE